MLTVVFAEQTGVIKNVPQPVIDDRVSSHLPNPVSCNTVAGGQHGSEGWHRDSDLHEFADSLRSDHARASGGETGERDHDSAPSRSRTEPSPVAKPLHLPLFPLCVSRLVNLWPPRSFSESVTKWVFPDDDSEERSKTARDSESDEEDDTQQRGVSFTILSDISSLLFMGNLALFLGLLVIVFTLHILLASGIEAYWMAKVRLTLQQNTFGIYTPMCSVSGFCTGGIHR